MLWISRLLVIRTVLFWIGFKPEGVLRPVRHWSKETRNTLGWFASSATDALRQLDAPDGCS